MPLNAEGRHFQTTQQALICKHPRIIASQKSEAYSVFSSASFLRNESDRTERFLNGAKPIHSNKKILVAVDDSESSRLWRAILLSARFEQYLLLQG